MDELKKNIKKIIQLEQASVEQNSILLQELMNHGVQNIDELDRVADRLLDTMHGITGEGEDIYRQYLDYIETFDSEEAKKRKDDLEYDLGYKTHVLYAAALLCQKEIENLFAPDGRKSFDVIMNEYIPKVYDAKKKTASFLFFIHLANGKSIGTLMKMLRTITEDTEYVMSNVDEFDDLMYYPKEEYHPLSEDEWVLIQFIAEHNLEIIDKYPSQKEEIISNLFAEKTSQSDNC